MVIIFCLPGVFPTNQRHWWLKKQFKKLKKKSLNLGFAARFAKSKQGQSEFYILRLFFFCIHITGLGQTLESSLVYCKSSLSVWVNPNSFLNPQSQKYILNWKSDAIPILRVSSWGESFRANSPLNIEILRHHPWESGLPRLHCVFPLGKKMAHNEASYKCIYLANKVRKITKPFYSLSLSDFYVINDPIIVSRASRCLTFSFYFTMSVIQDRRSTAFTCSVKRFISHANANMIKFHHCAKIVYCT